MDLFPRAEHRPTPSRAETSLYSALSRSKLPWTAFHSLRLRGKDGFEGEGDFVLVDPTRGMLVLEVKGGAIELRGGLWHQNGQAMRKSPRDQANGFVRRLSDELKPDFIPFGVACAFPDCDFSEGPASGDLRGLVLGRRDLAYLDEILPQLMAAALPPNPRAPASKKWISKLTELWGDTWVPRVSLTDRVEDAAARSIALDDKQYTVLEMAGDNPRTLVEGGAGTGKTLVATELCRRRSRAGQAALYLCFTDALAKAVQSQFDGSALPEPKPRATTIRQFAVELLRQTGQKIPAADAAFWDSVSLTAACESLPERKPDLVVVDEGQDFESGDWLLVEQLAGARGLWVFRDPRQAFWSDRPLPDALAATLSTQLKLQVSYRCPDGLTAFAESFVSEKPARAPDAASLRVVECSTDQELERVRHELDELRRQGAKPGDIVIVSLAGQTRSTLFKTAQLGSHRLVRGDSKDAGHQVVCETFLRFKGLERPFVVIAELSGSHVTHFETRMHIALTRATVQAIVVADSARISGDPRLKSVVSR